MNGAHERGLRMFVSANVREGQILFVSVFGLRVSEKLQNVECQTFKMLLIHWERKLKIRYPPRGQPAAGDALSAAGDAPFSVLPNGDAPRPAKRARISLLLEHMDDARAAQQMRQ